MRILLWSVERLITSLSAHGQDHDIDATLHVVLPGSPNRGMFGGDGGYGEAKSALDALVTRWKAEPAWADRVTLSHAIIGWVRGTGLMGGNDPLVEAVEAAGVRTWTPDEMAQALLETCTPAARAAALIEPLTVDLTGGLGGVDLDMRALAEGVERPAAEVEDETGMIAALASSPAQLDRVDTLEWAPVEARPEDLVVMVGAGELGPYGSSRTRFEVEVSDELSAAGILELAWTTGLVAWDTNAGGWYDTAVAGERRRGRPRRSLRRGSPRSLRHPPLRRRRQHGRQRCAAADLGVPRQGPVVHGVERVRGARTARRGPRAYGHRGDGRRRLDA